MEVWDLSLGLDSGDCSTNCATKASPAPNTGSTQYYNVTHGYASNAGASGVRLFAGSMARCKHATKSFRETVHRFTPSLHRFRIVLIAPTVFVILTLIYYISVTMDGPSISKLKDSRYIFNHFKAGAVDCPVLFKGVSNNTKGLASLKKARSAHNIRLDDVMAQSRSEDSFCEAFRRRRGYVMEPLNAEEAAFGLAYGILLYKDVEMFERLLRVIYRPQNVFCVHVDRSADDAVHLGVQTIAKCFDNVFVPHDTIDVEYGKFSALQAELLCMRHLLTYAKWWYFINLTGQEFPLRTNWELVRILKIFNGSNSIEGSLQRRLDIRFHTVLPPQPPQLTLTKGAVHIVASRAFVDYAINSEVAKRFTAWVQRTLIPDETFFSSLNHSPQLKVPGAFIGEPESHVGNNIFIARYKTWWNAGWGLPNLPCAGRYVRAICIFGLGDLKALGSTPELFANKFNADFEPLAYDCLEELLHRRTRNEVMRGVVDVNETFYAELAFVKSHV